MAEETSNPPLPMTTAAHEQVPNNNVDDDDGNHEMIHDMFDLTPTTLGGTKFDRSKTRTMETIEVSDSEDASSEEDNIIIHNPIMDGDHPVLSVIKNIGSGALLLFCIVVLTAAVFTNQTRATTAPYSLPPALAYALFWFCIVWLALIEGGLNCMVGLRPVQAKLYEESHPLTYKGAVLCLGRDNHNNTKKSKLERFIVGRQYMDLSMVFAISFLATASSGASVLQLPTIVNTIFLSSGLAMALVTIILGQLALQINAAHCMLDYMNNYAMLISTYLALAVETTGICHAAYFVQRIAAKLHHRKAPQETAPTSWWISLAFWIRVLFSLALLTFAMATVLVATFRGQTKMFVGVPPWATILLLIFLIGLVGMMDALQIALMAVVYKPSPELAHMPRALANSQLIKGKRLPSFLLGRQIGQTVIQFLLARITTLNVPIGPDTNIWGVSDAWQVVFNYGVLGSIITTLLASLCWRVLAAEFPLAFLQSRLAKPIIVGCLWTERTGIINISWALAALHRKVTGIQPDEYYLGSAGSHGGGHHHLDLEEDKSSAITVQKGLDSTATREDTTCRDITIHCEGYEESEGFEACTTQHHYNTNEEAQR